MNHFLNAGLKLNRDSGLALDAKLHGTYDNGGPMCCKT